MPKASTLSSSIPAPFPPQHCTTLNSLTYWRDFARALLMSTDSPSVNTTLQKGLKVLEIMARAGQPLTINGLSQELGIVKSNVHRLLQSLVEIGYVERVGIPAKYRCTLKLFELGFMLLDTIDVKKSAVEELQQPRTATQIPPPMATSNSST